MINSITSAQFICVETGFKCTIAELETTRGRKKLFLVGDEVNYGRAIELRCRMFARFSIVDVNYGRVSTNSDRSVGKEKGFVTRQ